MFQSSILLFQIIVSIALITESITFTNTQDIDRLMKLHSENGLNYQQQQMHLSSLGQRPTQFMASPQVALGPQQAIIHSNGGLIRPANNQNEANNFKSFNQPPKYLSQTSQMQIRGNPNTSTTIIDESRVNDNHRQEQQQQQQWSQMNVEDKQQSRASQRKLGANLWPDSPQLETPTQARNFLHGNIELALRQTSTDENVFQPSPAIGMPDSRDLEPWSLHSSSPRLPAITTTSSQVGEISTAVSNPLKQSDNQQQQQQQPEGTTTEQSNVIAAAASGAADILNPSSPSHRVVVDDYQQQPAAEILVPNAGQYQNEYPSSIGGFGQVTPPEVIGQLNQRQENSTEELHNHVIYEGPATAPPVGDYYFSSSERFPNNNKASNVWWSIGIGHEYEKASNLTRDDYLDYCSNSNLLITNKQRTLCKTHPMIMPIVARGLKMAIDECQFRFTSNRWNCSLVLQDTLEQAETSLAYYGNYSQNFKSSQPFGEVMKHPNRERSFLNAIVAAGLAHAMTKACSNGELPEECSCDKKIKSKNNRGKIEWVACSDDIDFGARFSRDFIDNTDNDSDTSSMINTHNYEVGRRIFKSATDITCTCQNSENGLCQTKRCWKHLGPFTDIGDELMRRYDSATHVQLSSKDPHKLRPVRRGVRRPKRKDLVYIDESPDYCTQNIRLGVLGTQNRRCNSTSSGPDSCSLLCCGRGYQVVVEEIEEDCNCKFVWCCQVKCDKCRRHITNDICN